MTRTTIIAAFAAIVAMSPATAADLTGNDFHEACKSGSSDFCSGYATGVRDGLFLGVHGGSKCWPNSLPAISGQQVHDVIVNYVRDHPERRHLPYLPLIAAALREAWPCEGE